MPAFHALVASSLLAVAQASPPVASPTPVMLHVETRVDVDESGRVVAVAPDGALPADINAVIAANVRSIRFQPPKLDGRAVRGVTFVRLDACAVPEAGHYRLATAYRGNGPSAAGSPTPRYPVDALRAARAATFDLTYHTSADGKAVVEKLERKGGGPFTREFAAAITDWVNALRVQPEQLDGQPVATRISKQFQFTVGGRKSFGSTASANKFFAAEAAKRQQEEIANNPSCIAALTAGTVDPTRAVALDSPFVRIELN